MATGEGLRERTRRLVQAEITTVGMDLFARNGFDAVTVEEIATAAGMSKRSFFRYFATKEDVVLGNLEAAGHVLADALAARPGDEPVWEALRRAFDVLVAATDADPARSLVLMRMLVETPVLKARHLEKQSRWQSLLVPHVDSRLTAAPPGVGRDPRAAAITAAALACFDTAQATWVELEGKIPIATLIDITMTAVRPIREVDQPATARPEAARARRPE